MNRILSLWGKFVGVGLNHDHGKGVAGVYNFASLGRFYFILYVYIFLETRDWNIIYIVHIAVPLFVHLDVVKTIVCQTT